MGYYEIERCPHCAATLEVRHGAGSRSPIGPEFTNCPSCDGVIRTYRTEWVDFSRGDRVEYYLQVFWWALGGVALVGGGGSVLAVAALSALDLVAAESIILVLVVLLIGLSFLVVLLTVRKARKEIATSRGRRPLEGSAAARKASELLALRSMDERIIESLRRTWRASGNALVSYSRDEVIGLVSGFDRLERYGGDKQAVGEYRNLPPEDQMNVHLQAFPEDTYVLED